MEKEGKGQKPVKSGGRWRTCSSGNERDLADKCATPSEAKYEDNRMGRGKKQQRAKRQGSQTEGQLKKKES